MADTNDAKAKEAAEKAYAAAAEKLEAEPVTEEAKPADTPIATAPAIVDAASAPAVEAPKAKPAPAPKPKAAAPVPAPEPKPAPAALAKKSSTARKATPAKRAPKPAVKPTAIKLAKPVKASTPKPTAAKAKARPTITAAATKTNGIFPPVSQLKDMIMAKPQTDFTAPIKEAFSEVQDKAKAAYEKSTAALGEYSEFTKGNVEALVESTKIFTAGIQELGSDLVAESRTAFETISADVKELSAVKSPADFFKLQGELLRRNFDSAVAYGSKNSEAFLKLTNDTFAPISSRVSVAVEKVRASA